MYKRQLYNGEYYIHKMDLEITDKYQYGEGCLSDQLIGQWLAHIVGLGYLLEPTHVRSAIKAVFAHNWRTDFWDHVNPQRIYALNDEQGLLLCSWPRGGRPRFPFPYSDEVWCGIEYQVASHLIYEGCLDEGLAIVKGVRARHDGVRRNPWNEFECGSHYARSMASWALLIALSGYTFDMPHSALGFAPRIWADDWQSFWSVDSAWGVFRQRLEEGSARVVLDAQYGMLSLQRLTLGSIKQRARVVVTLGGEMVSAEASLGENGLDLVFPGGVELRPEASLSVDLLW